MSFSASSPFGTALISLAVAACGGAREDVSSAPPGASSGSSESPPSTSTAPQCDASAARDVAVSSDDLNGYPPYAVADCSLVYVSSGGALVLRDLSTTAELTLAPASEKPRRPSIAVDVDGAARRLVVAWETTLATGPAVRVRYNEKVTTLQGDFVLATEPRARDHWVAFTAWKDVAESADTDVWLFDARTETSRLVLGGPAQQRFADVSATHVVATDFSEDPDGHFNRVNDLADIVIYEIASGKVTRRAAPGKQAFPMLSNNGALAYLAWNAVHPEPKLQVYDLKSGPLFGDPASDRTIAHVEYASAEPARPALAGEMLEWIANPDGTSALYRAPADGSSPPVKVAGLDGLVLYAPAPSSGAGFTVLAVADVVAPRPGSTDLDRSPRLRAVGR